MLFRRNGIFLACLQQSTAILRLIFFLVSAASSHMLVIGWLNRELQIATGLGAYSLVSLAASLVHTHQKLGHAYHNVDLIVAASYLGPLLYWIVSFARPEAPRREFTPQMRSLLLKLAGASRDQRNELLSAASLTAGNRSDERR